MLTKVYRLGARIVIRCPEELLIEFKKVAADFGGYRKAIEEFIRVYEEHPRLFNTKIKRRRRVEYA